MSTTTTSEAHTAHAEEHHELGFIRTYIFSTDHKMIARQFLFTGLLFLLIGGTLAVLIRWQLGFPGPTGSVDACEGVFRPNVGPSAG